MRILHIIDSMDPARGGPVESVLQTSEWLTRLGHSCAVLSPDNPADEWLNSIRLEHFAVGHVTRRYKYSPALAKWLKASAANFDVVIIHGLWTHATLASARTLARIQVPFAIFVHGMMDPWFAATYPIKNLAKQLYWRCLLAPPMRSAAAILFTAAVEADNARLSFRFDRDKARVITYGTADPPARGSGQDEAFRAAVPQLGSRAFILFLGRLHPKKGCDLVLKGFASVAPDRLDLDLVLAGPDQVGWQRELKALACELGLEHRVHFPGMLTGDAKWGAFYAAEAFILPSHQENFGIAVAEALACGTPVLISDKIAIAQPIKAWGAGLVEPDSQQGTDALFAKFAAMSWSELAQMERKARTCFLEEFGIDRSVADLLAVLQDAVLRA